MKLPFKFKLSGIVVLLLLTCCGKKLTVCECMNTSDEDYRKRCREWFTNASSEEYRKMMEEKANCN